MARIILDSERELEEYIVELIERTGMCPLDVETYQYVFSQVSLGAYGIADIIKVRFDKDYISVVIMELKKDVVDVNTVLQVLKYYKGLIRFIKARYKKLHIKNYEKISVSLQLAAPSISNDPLFKVLCSEIKADLRVYKVDFSLFDSVNGQSQDFNYAFDENDFKQLNVIATHLNEAYTNNVKHASRQRIKHKANSSQSNNLFSIADRA